MTTTAEKIAVMQAFEDGKKIEAGPPGTHYWGPQATPSWNWELFNYRVKKEPREFWVNPDNGIAMLICDDFVPENPSVVRVREVTE